MSIGEAMPSLLKRADAFWRETTAGMRVLPECLIIGAPRSGTSTLYEYVARHPCVGRAFRKEVHFFDQNFDKGLSWYRARFPTIWEKRWRTRKYGGFVTGESSPSYPRQPEVPERVAGTLPAVKLIAILRNPVERAYSGYQRTVRQKRESRSFADAAEAQMRGETGAYPYLTPGLYADQIARWLSCFARERLLVLCAERLFADPLAGLEHVSRFLQLPAVEDQQSVSRQLQRWVRKKYSYERYAPMDEALRARLTEYFRPHNERLYRIIGEDFGWPH